MNFERLEVMIVNKECVIIDGLLKGTEGVLVAYDYRADEVVVQVDDITQVTMSSDYIRQEI